MDILRRLRSAFLRKALRPRKPTVRVDAFPTFNVRPDAPPLTTEMVRNALGGS